MPLTPLDLDRLNEAHELAEGAIGLSDPNPRVGCVIGLPDGTVLGRGHTQHAGGPHAEIMALRDLSASGLDARGATAWVTLEPCAHHGRTPPCCEALIDAGIGRVVMACEDPFPAVAGQGAARLRGAGVEVVAGTDAHAQATRELNIGYFSRIERARPWVRLKAATSLDGRSALADGQSQWITGAAARHDGHNWRRRAGAILTGVGTVLADDPRLDVRHVPTARQPIRAVLDTKLRTPPTARLFQVPGQVRLYCDASATAADRLLLAAQRVPVPTQDGRPALDAVLADLAALPVNEVHVEAGGQLNGALLAARLVDELLLYLAPMLIGPGRALAELPHLTRLDEAERWSAHEVTMLGSDLRLRLLRPHDAASSENLTAR